MRSEVDTAGRAITRTLPSREPGQPPRKNEAKSRSDSRERFRLDLSFERQYSLAIRARCPSHRNNAHLVEERLGGDEVYALQIHFIDPKEIFGAEAFDAALANGDVSAIVAAQIGMGEEPLRDERGRPSNGRMAHICRDTPDGMVLRSRFWLGGGSGLPPEALRGAISEEVGLGLMRHANTEFKYLSRFLPSLYVADRREAEPVEPAVVARAQP